MIYYENVQWNDKPIDVTIKMKSNDIYSIMKVTLPNKIANELERTLMEEHNKRIRSLYGLL